MDGPRMTYYTKTLDNIDNHQLLGYASTAKNKKLYYGKCNGLTGGESQFVVEFDIWNNEPAWDGGTPQIICSNAFNCHMTIDMQSETRNLSPFFYARCTTYDLNSEFSDISMNHKTFYDIQGNSSDEYGVILGVSDHATIQTKIKLRANSKVTQEQYKFALNFLYNYE